MKAVRSPWTALLAAALVATNELAKIDWSAIVGQRFAPLAHVGVTVLGAFVAAFAASPMERR